jgi:hypothetical protein
MVVKRYLCGSTNWLTPGAVSTPSLVVPLSIDSYTSFAILYGVVVVAIGICLPPIGNHSRNFVPLPSCSHDYVTFHRRDVFIEAHVKLSLKNKRGRRMKVHADFRLFAAAHFDATQYLPSPAYGVHRFLLDRIGRERARATTIVQYQPNS